MANANWDKVGEALLRRVEASHLKQYLKEPLEEVINPLLAGGKIYFSECVDLILLSIFTHIDLLGHLYKGKNSSSNAVEFMREYLGSVDKRYKEVSGLLYHALRHGLVHLATPKRIQLKDGKILDFSFGRIGRREDYLKVTKTLEIQRTGERVGIYRLFLDLSLLHEDLLSAIDEYAEDIHCNQVLSDVFKKSFETRRKPEKAKEEDLLKNPKTKYIQQSDFDFVRAQISNL